jgi:hypothetical protein
VPTFRTGTVVDVVDVSPDGVQRLDVDVAGEVRRAVLYPRWAAPAHAGDRVVVNTTAVDLELGTGGSDFVVWNHAVESYDSTSGGHIMKLRYTPAQCDVLAVEEQDSPHHSVMSEARSLDDVPVVATSLHSQLLPVLCGLRRHSTSQRVAYVMTDGAALEAGFSHTLRALRAEGWLCGVITSGHAVGGDHESVTLHSGLLAARHVLDADVIVAGLGPGVVGTATPYGTTALELGTIALAAQSLDGRSVVCVRLSEADPRPRHRGLSHHVVAALGWVASGIDPSRTCVVAPTGWGSAIGDALPSWRVVEQDAGDVGAELADAASLGMSSSHMGRTPDEDKLFFEAAAAAGVYAATLVNAR